MAVLEIYLEILTNFFEILYPPLLSDLSTVSSIYSTSANYSFCCSVGFAKLATEVMNENNLLWPSNRDKSKALFLKLTNVLGSIQ